MNYNYYMLEFDLGDKNKYDLLRSKDDFLFEVYNTNTKKWKYSDSISWKIFGIRAGKHDASSCREITKEQVDDCILVLSQNDYEKIKKFYTNLKQNSCKKVENIEL